MSATKTLIITYVKTSTAWLMINVPVWLDSVSTWVTVFSTLMGAMIMVITYKRARIKLKITELELKEKEDEAEQ